MTNEDKANQVGSLMIELKSARTDAAQHRGRVTRMQRELARAGSGTLRFALTQDNEEFLAINGGHWESRVNLPTAEELLAAVKQHEETERLVRELVERLQALGFNV